MNQRRLFAKADWVEHFADLDSLAFDADAIARGRVVKVQPSYLVHGVVFTDALFEVEDFIKPPEDIPPSPITLW